MSTWDTTRDAMSAYASLGYERYANIAEGHNLHLQIQIAQMQAKTQLDMLRVYGGGQAGATIHTHCLYCRSTHGKRDRNGSCSSCGAPSA